MRRTRKTLYVVTSLYVFLGLVILIGAAVIGDPLSSFIGFVIVGGALGAAVVLVNLFRLRERLDRLYEVVRQLSDDVRSVSTATSPSDPSDSSVGMACETTNLDLTTLGDGEVSVLTAATLDRDRFPRLFVSMDNRESDTAKQPGPSPSISVDDQQSFLTTLGANGVASRNLLREWKIAMRSRNLRDGRRIFSALVDLGSAQLVDSLYQELIRLTESVENRFRSEFSTLVNARQFGEALALGDEMAELFAGQPLEAQFSALKPALQRALAKTAARDQACIANG